MTAINTGKCPRCSGAVIDYQASDEDGPTCLTCGWRDQKVSPDVQREIDASLGQARLVAPPRLNEPSRVDWWQERVQERPSLYNLNAS